MKKILTVVLLWTALCGTAFSQDAKDFEVNAQGVITKYTGFDTDIKIPDTIGGKKITAIGNGAFQKADLTSVTIPNGVTEIGENAFADNKLTSITIPGSVKVIKDSAFRDNTTLTTIVIPEGVESIGRSAFVNTKCTSYTFPSTLREIASSYPFDTSGKPSLTLAANIISDFGNNGSVPAYINYIANDRKAGTYEWFDLNSIKKTADDYEYYETQYGAVLSRYTGSSTRVRVPAEIGGIPVKALYRFSGRNGYQGVFQSSFFDNNNRKIDAVQIPEGITYIGKSAFEENNLGSVTIPNSVTYIGEAAFIKNYSLTSVTLGNKVMCIGVNAFYRNKLESITIPNSVTFIGKEAFYGNGNLGKITIGRNVWVGKSCFTFGDNDIDAEFDKAYNNAGKAAGTYNRRKDNMDYYRIWVKQ